MSTTAVAMVGQRPGANQQHHLNLQPLQHHAPAPHHADDNDLASIEFYDYI